MEDILAEAKLDVLEVFESADLKYDYDNIKDQREENQWVFLPFTNMTEMKMMIETRPRYPSDKFTFTIADLMKNKHIRWLDIGLNLKRRFDVDVVLEDSQRDFLSSILLLLIFLGIK